MTNLRMKRWGMGLGGGLVMLGVVGLGASLQGCGGGGGTPVCNLASNISTTWSLEENGAPVECLDGDTVSIRVDDDSMIQDFDCSAHAGTTPDLQGGVTHRVSFELTDAGGNLLSQTGDMSLFVPCGAVQPTPAVVFTVSP